MTMRSGVLAMMAALACGASAALAVTSPGEVDIRDELSAPPIQSTPAAPPRPAVQTQAAPTPSPNPLWAIPLRQLSASRERPLFSPSRRPAPVVVAPAYQVPTAPAPPAKPPEPDKPQLSLIGTVAGSDESIGVFLDPAAKTVLRLRTGEAHKGWVLRTVNRRDVVLEKGRDSAVLSLPAPEPAKPGAVPPAGAPGAGIAGPAAVPGAPPQPMAPAVPVIGASSPGQATSGWTPQLPQLKPPAPAPGGAPQPGRTPPGR